MNDGSQLGRHPQLGTRIVNVVSCTCKWAGTRNWAGTRIVFSARDSTAAAEIVSPGFADILLIYGDRDFTAVGRYVSSRV